MARADRMPERGSVDPLFDGHLERPLLDLSPEERLDWIWEMMELVRLARPERVPKGVRQLRPGGEAPLGKKDDAGGSVKTGRTRPGV